MSSRSFATAIFALLLSSARAVDLSTFDCPPPSSSAAHVTWRFHVPPLPDEFVAKPWRQSEELDFWRANRDTSHYEGERFYARLLRSHPCHTDEVDQALAFYVPAQTDTAHSLADWGPRRRENWGDYVFYRNFEREVIKFLRRRWPKRTDADLLLSHYVSTWMFKHQRGWPQTGMGFVGPEVTRGKGLLLNAAGRWDLDLVRQGYQDITIPYLDRGAQQELTASLLASVQRDYLVVFHGSTNHRPIRLKLREHFHRHPDRAHFEETTYGPRRATNDTWAKSATRGAFGVMVSGDTLTSRRLFSFILAETIPVIIDDLLVLPYAAFLDWRQFAVFVPERRLFEDPGFDLVPHLESISRAEVERLQTNLRVVRRHFVFNEDRILPGDAIDLSVREMAMASLKIRSNLDVVRRNVEYGRWSAARDPVREDEQPLFCRFLKRLCWQWEGL